MKYRNATISVATLIYLTVLQVSDRDVSVLKPSIQGPLLVILLKDRCPCTSECRLSLNALADACRNKIKVVALLDASASKANALAKKFNLEVPIMSDPKMVLIRALGGKRALDLRLLNVGGKIVGRWDGFSRANVRAIEGVLREELGISVSIPLSTFTNLTKYGCAFGI